MTADVFFGERRHEVELLNRIDSFGILYFGARLKNGEVVYSSCATGKGTRTVTEVAREIARKLKRRGVKSVRVHHGVRLRFTNRVLVFCNKAGYDREMEFEKELRKKFRLLEPLHLDPPPVRDPRTIPEPKPVNYL